jgi:hypothetical protein
MAASIETLQQLASEGGHAKLVWAGEQGAGRRGRLCDCLTARAIVLIHDAASDENKAKVARMVAASVGQFLKVQAFAFKHVSF